MKNNNRRRPNANSRKKNRFEKNADNRSENNAEELEKTTTGKRNFRNKRTNTKRYDRPVREKREEKEKTSDFSPKKRAEKTDSSPRPSKKTETWRLNRYIANSGVCSRREADVLIQKGEISVNGKVVTELGYKVKPNDTVKHKGKLLRREKPVYVLLNKPKDFITTTKDPQGRKTVMDLVKRATTERIYPVGRLDRQTTGLLLFTNDGETAKKLSHPSYEVQKIYKVTLDKPFTEEGLEKLKAGLNLEDGFAKVDNASILSADGLSIGVELHIGKNRIVRRLFSHLGYEVVKLDRTVYAGLTKETLGRGQWRLLNEREIIRLRFFNKRGK